MKKVFAVIVSASVFIAMLVICLPPELPQMGELLNDIAVLGEQTYCLAQNGAAGTAVYKIDGSGTILGAIKRDTGTKTREEIISIAANGDVLYYLTRLEEESACFLYRIDPEFKEEVRLLRIELEARFLVTDFLAAGDKAYITGITENKKASVYEIGIAGEVYGIGLLYECRAKEEEIFLKAAYDGNAGLYILQNSGKLFVTDGIQREDIVFEAETRQPLWIRGIEDGILYYDFLNAGICIEQNKEERELAKTYEVLTADCSKQGRLGTICADKEGKKSIAVLEGESWKEFDAFSIPFLFQIKFLIKPFLKCTLCYFFILLVLYILKKTVEAQKKNAVILSLLNGIFLLGIGGLYTIYHEGALESERLKESASNTVFFDGTRAYITESEEYVYGTGLCTAFGAEAWNILEKTAETEKPEMDVYEWNGKRQGVLITAKQDRINPNTFYINRIWLEDLDDKNKKYRNFYLTAVFLFCIAVGIFLNCFSKYLEKKQREGTVKAADKETEAQKENSAFFLRFRFIPHQFEKLMGKEQLSDLRTGEIKNVEGTAAVICSPELGNRSECLLQSGYIDSISRFITVISRNSEENRGIIVSSGSRMDEIKTIFPNSPDDAMKFGVQSIKEFDLWEIKNYGIDSVLFLHYTSYLCGLIGGKNRVYPLVNIPEIQISRNISENLCAMNVKMVITANTKEMLKKEYGLRYLGFTEFKNKEYHLYEVLDALGEREHSLKKSTDVQFQKALQLFYKKDFYLARSAFSEVLKENRADGIAKWYLFRCESLLNTKDEKDMRFEIFV